MERLGEARDWALAIACVAFVLLSPLVVATVAGWFGLR